MDFNYEKSTSNYMIIGSKSWQDIIETTDDTLLWFIYVSLVQWDRIWIHQILQELSSMDLI